jgi:hypothetical protein
VHTGCLLMFQGGELSIRTISGGSAGGVSGRGVMDG